MTGLSKMAVELEMIELPEGVRFKDANGTLIWALYAGDGSLMNRFQICISGPHGMYIAEFCPEEESPEVVIEKIKSGAELVK